MTLTVGAQLADALRIVDSAGVVGAVDGVPDDVDASAAPLVASWDVTARAVQAASGRTSATARGALRPVVLRDLASARDALRMVASDPCVAHAVHAGSTPTTAFSTVAAALECLPRCAAAMSATSAPVTACVACGADLSGDDAARCRHRRRSP